MRHPISGSSLNNDFKKKLSNGGDQVSHPAETAGSKNVKVKVKFSL